MNYTHRHLFLNTDTVGSVGNDINCLIVNTSDSFAIPIGGERVTWGCLNLCYITGCERRLRASLDVKVCKRKTSEYAPRLYGHAHERNRKTHAYGHRTCTCNMYTEHTMEVETYRAQALGNG